MGYTQALNKKVSSLHKSPTLKITSLAKKLRKEGEDVVIFAAGEPDFDTPAFVKTAAKKALDDGDTKYTPSAGLPELRQALSEKFKTQNDLAYSPQQILVTTGAKYALFLALFSLIDSPEDEVILPAPYWVSYPEMVTMAGGTLKTVMTSREDGFKLTPRALAEAVTERTRVLILNYPSNPTGVTYDEKELRELWNVVKEKRLCVVADEIYESILFDGRIHTSFASLDKDALRRTITVNGFSKSFSMTGWRLGYLAGAEEVIGEISKVIDHTTSCANAFAQKGAIAALAEGKEWVENARREFEARRDLICSEFAGLKQISVLRPQGTFYLFCDISRTGLSAMDFASRLLEEQRVAVIPSEGFGVDGYIRISFATGRETIKKGVARIREFLKTL